MITLNSKIEEVNGIAKRIAPKLKKLGVETVEDLLFYWPFRWEDWRNIKMIAEIEPNTNATIQGQIELIENKRSQWKKMLITEAIVSDENSKIKAVWFHQPYLIKNLHVGDRVFLSGKASLQDDELQFVHPEYEKISRYKDETTHTARIVSIYPLTKGLTLKQLRYVISCVIHLANKLEEWLPQDIINQNKLINLENAVRQLHLPDDEQSRDAALDRIKFDELFLIQLRAAITKANLQKANADKIKFKKEETQKQVNSLPFSLTDAQKITSWEILKDLDKHIPMNRLLEGDVGSGKTVVSSLAILNTLLNNYQVAYMVPTEILAKQHFKTMGNLFNKWDINIALLTSRDQKISRYGEITTIKKNELYKLINSGEVGLVIGTQAIIQDKVNFKDLALIVLDEQHRFGVEQRKKLRQKRTDTVPHLLSMTATPIPRTLALTIYGDLDLSIIDQLPGGRKKIKTEVVPPEYRSSKYQFVKEHINKGEQVFVICPLIDPSDKLGVKAVKDEFEKLDKKIFPNIPIGLMHGKLKSKEKEQIMQDFIDKKTKILVSTPVIEVGIDIPNATIMFIESAERFGLAQLHQFRGRVGRGEKQSYCFLFTESDSRDTMKRLNNLVKSNNGFELAEADLEFRGPGEVYGIRQSGHKDELKVAKLTDYIIIKKSKSAVDNIMKTNAELDLFPKVKERLKKFEETVHFE